MTADVIDRAARRPASALEPVRIALLADARAEAARIVESARDEADAIVEHARHEADEVVQQARRRADSTATAHAARALLRAARDAQSAVMHAREAVRRELVRRLELAVARMRDDARYPALLDRLEDVARGQLGQDALIERDPSDGGIVAVDGSRRVDYRLPALAERVLETFGDEEAALWS